MKGGKKWQTQSCRRHLKLKQSHPLGENYSLMRHEFVRMEQTCLLLTSTGWLKKPQHTVFTDLWTKSRSALWTVAKHTSASPKAPRRASTCCLSRARPLHKIMPALSNHIKAERGEAGSVWPGSALKPCTPHVRRVEVLGARQEEFSVFRT